ncbi:MAG: DUF4037 domain-containing protein [Eubacteriales bacterium]|nr:DUF4037 domain-containing protein [Eubacteriales bacterium]
MLSIEQRFESLLTATTSLSSVRAVGKTGGSQLPADSESDVDLFVFCERIPTRNAREEMLSSLISTITIDRLGDFEDTHWGLVDSLRIGSLEVYLMYFTIRTFSDSLEAILRGDRLDREANYFYPTGRCASILGMHVFYDPDCYLKDWKQRLDRYPESLAQALISHHAALMDDAEDFRRAVRRGDTLFFHATLDLAIEHFLQTLFALNHVYFPSRKRTVSYIQSFSKAPINCDSRLQNVIRLGASSKTLFQSYALWKNLCAELNTLLSV